MAVQKRNAELVELLSCDFVRNDGELHLSTVAVAATPYAANNKTVMLVTTGAGNITLNLPASANQLGKVYVIKKVDAGVGLVRITPAGAETIDGAPTYDLTAQWQAVMIVSNGSNWYVI